MKLHISLGLDEGEEKATCNLTTPDGTVVTLTDTEGMKIPIAVGSGVVDLTLSTPAPAP